MDDNKSGTRWNTLIAILVAVALWLWWESSEKEAEDGGTFLDDLGPVGDIGRTVMDVVSPSSYPPRWGGGIRQLVEVARPFFAALFTAMEAKGWHPRSNYPHASYNEASYGPGPRALDIVDNDWPRNAWMTPVDPYVAFYRDLGAEAERLGLVWGGRWQKFSGDGSAWAKAWKALGMGDMLHVEWRPSTGSSVPT